MSRGWIYILSNEQLRADLFKVGITTRSPEIRARELHNTSSAFPWRVEYAALVDDCRSVEQQVQLQLRENRVASNREFYELPLHKLVDALNRIADVVGRIEPTNSTLPPTSMANMETFEEEWESDVSTETSSPSSMEKQLQQLRFWTFFVSRNPILQKKYPRFYARAYEHIQLHEPALTFASKPHGASYYFTIKSTSIRAELFFNASGKQLNHNIFDRFLARKNQIEADVETKLDWRKLVRGQEGHTCGIKYIFANGDYRQRSDWNQLASPATDAFVRFEAALSRCY